MASMDEIDNQLLSRSANQVGIVGCNKSEDDRLDRLAKLGFVAIAGSDAPHSAPMSSVYRITDLGRTALAKLTN